MRVASAKESWHSVFTLIFATPSEIAFLIISSGIPVPPCKSIADLGVDMLAAGIGNIHGKYPENWAGFFYRRLDRLRARSKQFARVKAFALQILACLDIFACRIRKGKLALGIYVNLLLSNMAKLEK